MRIEFLALRLANNQNLREESWDAGCCSLTWPILLLDLHTTHLVPSPVFVYSLIPYWGITSWSRSQVLWTQQLEMKFMFFIWKKTKQTKKNKMKQRNFIINKAKKPTFHPEENCQGEKHEAAESRSKFLIPGAGCHSVSMCLSASLVAQASECTS